MSERPPLKAWMLLILLALIWGSSFILIKKGLANLTSLEVGAIRMLTASITLLPFVWTRIQKVKRSKMKYFIAVGLSGSFIPAFFFAIAQTRIESAVTGILNALTPLFTVLIGLWLFDQKQKMKVWIGISFGFLGSILLITAGSNGDISKINYYGFFVVAATVLYAINSNMIKYKLSEYDSLTITSISLLFVGPMSIFVLLFFSDFFYRFDEKLLASTLYISLLGVVGTAIALIIFNKIVQLTNPVFTSSVTYIIPLVALFWGLMDNEMLILNQFLGMLSILIGVYITNQTAIRRKTERI